MTKRIYNQGGLGNQLFIWKAAHQLNAMTGEKVEIITLERTDNQRELGLGVLSHSCHHEIELKSVQRLPVRIKFAQKFPRIYKLIKSTKLLQKSVEISINPQESISSLHLNATDFLGFFQDPLDSLAVDIESLNEIKMHASKVWKKTKNQIIENLNGKYQVFHVRRGDYLQNIEYFGILTEKYFLANSHDGLPVYISTDAKNIESSFLRFFESARVLNSSELDAWQSLALMHSAEHFIGSNSTLSWWAARLRTTDRKSTVLPTPWFKSSEYQPNFRINGIVFAKSNFK